MRIRVLYFGALREIFRREDDTVSLADGATVATLMAHYRATAPEQSSFWSAIAVAVNQEFARADQALAEDDEVALLPPVSGGSGSDPHVALVAEPIASVTLVEALKQGEDGAVVVFDGIVRNHTRGRRTLYLIYEAYEEMALVTMRKLANEARDRFAVRDVVLVHRLGQIAVGETSVLIARRPSTPAAG
jgi:MoaE-MoaD fusion protein